MSRRMDRVNELLKREIADTLYRVMNERGFDLSVVTVTRVRTSPDLRSARVGISIRDHETERDAILRRIESHRVEIQRRINKDTRLRYTPHLEFELDTSIAEGDHILALIAEIEREEEERREEGESEEEERGAAIE